METHVVEEESVQMKSAQTEAVAGEVQVAAPAEVTVVSEEDADTAADMKVILIVFGALVALAVHAISGFTVDF